MVFGAGAVSARFATALLSEFAGLEDLKDLGWNGRSGSGTSRYAGRCNETRRLLPRSPGLVLHDRRREALLFGARTLNIQTGSSDLVPRRFDSAEVGPLTTMASDREWATRIGRLKETMFTGAKDGILAPM